MNFSNAEKNQYLIILYFYIILQLILSYSVLRTDNKNFSNLRLTPTKKGRHCFLAKDLYNYIIETDKSGVDVAGIIFQSSIRKTDS